MLLVSYYMNTQFLLITFLKGKCSISFDLNKVKMKTLISKTIYLMSFTQRKPDITTTVMRASLNDARPEQLKERLTTICSSVNIFIILNCQNL